MVEDLAELTLDSADESELKTLLTELDTEDSIGSVDPIFSLEDAELMEDRTLDLLDSAELREDSAELEPLE